MKKAAAFLTLTALLALIVFAVILNQNEAAPTLNDLQAVVVSFNAMIPASMHTPIMTGFVLFFLAGSFLALMVMFERQAIQAPAGPSLEEFDRFKTKCSELEAKQEENDKHLKTFQTANESLKTQLESAIQKNKDLETRQKETLAAREKIEAELQNAINTVNTAGEDKKRLQTETEALLCKIEKLETESKNARKDSEKSGTQLKAAQADLDRRNTELAELRKQFDTLSHELKAAQANLKGGKEAIPPAAYQILYLFQKEGRLIDLLSEDISELDDETLGGAIRPIHEGCRRLLEDRLILERVLNEEEGSEVTLDEVDPESIKLSGKVPASGPYRGELIHRGWRLKECNLPELVDGWKGNVIAPAEIEIS